MPKCRNLGVLALCGVSTETLYLPAIEYIGRNNTGQGALSYCSRLRVVDLGENLTSMDTHVFYKSENIEQLIVRAKVPPTVSGGLFPYTSTSKLHIYVPADSVSAYKAAGGWKDYANKIQAIDEQ